MVLKLYVGTEFRENGQKSRKSQNLIPLRYSLQKVYKQTIYTNFLFNICYSCLKHSVVPLQWRYVMEHFIPKTKLPCPSYIKHFHPIALLNV